MSICANPDRISEFTVSTCDDEGASAPVTKSGNTYTLDVWNRMVTGTVGSSVGTYSYDADGRRPGLYRCGPTTDGYYSAAWQDVEDDSVSGSTTSKNTCAWSLSYTNDLVERDQKVGSNRTTRLYVQQDAKQDVTSLLNASRSVLQRYIYDPYGTAAILKAGMTAVVADGYGWVYTFQGGRYDPVTGKINFRHRDLDTVIGTWMEKDPAGYVDGANLYQYEGSFPVDSVDPMGLYGEVHTTYIRDNGPATQPTTRPGFKGDGHGTRISIGGRDVEIGVVLSKLRGEEYIRLIAKSPKDQYPCQDCEWLQFVHRIVVGATAPVKFRNKSGDEYSSTVDPSKPVYRTDNNRPGNPFASYEYSGAKRGVSILQFIDAPGFADINGQAQQAIYDSFLVCDGKVQFHIHWERDKSVASDRTYSGIEGESTDTLPDWAKRTLETDGFKDPTKS